LSPFPLSRGRGRRWRGGELKRGKAFSIFISLSFDKGRGFPRKIQGVRFKNNSQFAWWRFFSVAIGM
jgi:hypothetical protein